MHSVVLVNLADVLKGGADGMLRMHVPLEFQRRGDRPGFVNPETIMTMCCLGIGECLWEVRFWNDAVNAYKEELVNYVKGLDLVALEERQEKEEEEEEEEEDDEKEKEDEEDMQKEEGDKEEDEGEEGEGKEGEEEEVLRRRRRRRRMSLTRRRRRRRRCRSLGLDYLGGRQARPCRSTTASFLSSTLWG